jgi:hypothetical protein
MKRIVLTAAIFFITSALFSAEVKRFSYDGVEITGLENGRAVVFFWNVGEDDEVTDWVIKDTKLYGKVATKNVTDGTWKFYPGSGRMVIVIVQNGVEEAHVVGIDW